MDIKLLKRNITPEAEETQEQAAMRIGKEPKTMAHMVLFGDIRREDGELYIKPSIAVIEKFGDTEITGRDMAAGLTRQSPGEPDYLTLKKTKTTETADMVALITGLAFFRRSKYNDALAFLKTVQNPEAAFYRGNIYYESAATSSDPVPLYKKSADEYAIALIGWGKTSPQDWAMTQNNLGAVYQRLGERLGGAEWIEYLNKAMAAYNNALEVYTEALPYYHKHVMDNRQIALDAIARLQPEGGGAYKGQ